MVFGMISAAGTEPLVRLHSKINTTVYKEILQLNNQLYLCKMTLHVTQ